MTIKNTEDLYQRFLEFVEKDLTFERHAINRKMFTVFFWCFILPAILSATLLMMVKLRALPYYLKSHLDWFVLIFPVTYSVYVFYLEVIPKVSEAVKRKGLVRTLSNASKEGEWRNRVLAEMTKAVEADHEEWKWITTSFKMDLASMEYRNRYLTALAGAVFFLIMQGIDSVMDANVDSSLGPYGGLESAGNDFTQFVGLALFLILLYLSGSQTYNSMTRYLNCAELIRLKKSDY